MAVPVSRMGRIWVALGVGLVLLVLVLVFIFQNLQDARVHFFGTTGVLPLALALLFAAVAGALIVVALGSVRIVQLRRELRRRSAATAGGHGAGHSRMARDQKA